jgi:hypothetical protein
MNKTPNDVLSAIYCLKTLRCRKIIFNWLGDSELVSDSTGAVTGLGDDKLDGGKEIMVCCQCKFRVRIGLQLDWLIIDSQSIIID